MSSLVLIDITSVSYLESFVSCLLPGVDYVAFSMWDDCEEVKARIPNKQYDNVAVLQHNRNEPVYAIMLDSSVQISPLLSEVETHDPALQTWAPVKSFVQWLHDNRGVKHFDLLACDLWADNNWKYVINKLNLEMGVKIRASLDATGLDSNYMLESDNVDTIGLYFTEDVKQYPQVFRASQTYKYSQSQPPLTFDASSNATLYISKYSSLMTAQSAANGNYIAQPFDISNVKHVVYGSSNSTLTTDYAVLRNDGSVVRWGSKQTAMRFVSTTTDPELTNVKQIVSGTYAFAALKYDGTVVCWGMTGYGLSICDITDGTQVYNTPFPTGLSNVKQLYANGQAFWALKNDGTVVSWGGKSGMGGAGDTSLYSSLLVDVKKVCIFSSNGGGFCALRNDGSVVIGGNANPWIGAAYHSRYATTVGNAAWAGKVVDIYDELNSVSLFNGVYGIYPIGWVPKYEPEGGFNTMPAHGPYIALPTGVTVVAQDMLGSLIVGARYYLSNGQMVVVAYGGVRTFDCGQFVAPDEAACTLYLNKNGGALTPIANTDARAGGNFKDTTWGLPVGADVSSNVVQLYSCQSGLAVRKGDGSFVTWGCGIVNTPLRVNTATSGVTDVIGVYEINQGYILKRSDNSLYNVTGGWGGYNIGPINAPNPADKTVWLMGLSAPGLGLNTIALELTPCETITPTTPILEYALTTVTYYSNRWERMATVGIPYALYANGKMISSVFIPSENTMTYTFQNTRIPTGVTSVSIGVASTNVPNVVVTFNVNTIPNPYVSAPDAPTINTVSITSSTSASVAYELPSWDGGIPITAVKYSIDGGATFTTASSMVSPLLLTNITQGAVDFQLVVTNPFGDSYSANYQIVMCDPPIAPVITSVSGGNRKITVNFTPSYTNPASSTFEVSGMTGNTYTMTGNANALLNGQYVASASGTGNGGAWTLFDANNSSQFYSPETYYNPTGIGAVCIYGGPVATPVETIGTISGEWLQIKFPNPIVFTGYTFSGYAHNYFPGSFWVLGSYDGSKWYPLNYQTGQWAGAGNVNTYTVNEALSAGAFKYFRMVVTGVNYGSQFILRRFAVIGYPALADSVVGYKYSVNGGAYVSKGPRISPLTITGLNNSASYTVTMKAINAAGDSVVSNTSASVALTAYAPESPVLVSASAAVSGQITFTFQAPYNGGSAITGYVYRLNDTFVNFGTESSTVTITGLTNGTNYSLSIGAINAVGTSPASNMIENLMPKDVPQSPIYRNTYPRNGAVIVQFSPRASNGAYVSNMLYSVNDGAYAPVFNWDNNYYVDITGLTNGTEYAVRFIAVNSVGQSLPSDPVYVTPCDVPSVPLITNVVALDGTANVSFTQGSTNGAEVTQYDYMLNSPYPNAVESMLFTGGRCIEVPANADLQFGTGDFTIEWYQSTPWAGRSQMHSFSFGSGYETMPLCVRWWDGACRLCVNGVWYEFGYVNIYETIHVALSRVSGVLRLFINGVLRGQPLSVPDDISPTQRLLIGSDETSNYQFFGYIQAFTWIKGWGKYVDTFTPPLTPVYSVPQGTLVLFIVGVNNPALGSLGSTAVIPQFESWGYTNVAGYFSPQFVTIANDVTSPLAITGLTNGVDYTVRIRAKNSAGYSAASENASFKPMSVADAPIITNVTYGNRSVVLDFSAVVLPGNSPIVGYKLSTNNGPFVSLGLISSPYTVTGLVNGTTYSFRLKGVCSIGDTESSVASALVVPRRAPDAPVITVTDNVLQATVGFGAGASDGGSEILSYTYSYDDGESVTLSAPEEQTYSLVLGETHTFTVYATNEAGNSAVASVTLIGKNLPDAPVIEGIDAGDKTAHVTFTAGSSNYSDITGYKYNLDGGEYQNAVVGSDGAIVISGLSENVTYSVCIVAVNSVGTSEPSNAWSVTPYTKPSACVLDGVTAGDASVSFTIIPGLANNSPITSYKYSLNNKPYVVLPDLSTEITLSDLSNGILYNLKVKSTNAAGDAPSSNSVSFMPYTIPDAPTVVSVTAGNEGCEVYFTPGFFNGSNITQYKYALNGGVYNGSVFVPAAEIASPIQIQGLDNGTVYTVTLLAVNGAGESNASNTSTSFAPFVTQSTANPPLLQSATVSNRSVSIAYVDDVNLGSAIIGYKYSLNGGAYRWFAQTSSPLEIHELENGVEYSVTVKSVNNSGASVPSPALTFTPCAAPATPIILNGVAGDAQVTVYLADLESNGSPITEVQCSLNGGDFFNVDVSGGAFVVQSLANGTEYTARVQCVNALGVSGVSNVSEMMRPVGLPFPPAITNVVLGDEMVTVHFSEADGNGMPILKYSYCLIDNGVAGLYLSTEDLSSPIVITGLTNGHTYALRMKSLTQMGESSATLESEDFVPYGMPFAPVITKAEYANDVLTVHFSEVGSNGKPVTDYLYSLDGVTYFSSSQLVSPITVSNLAIGSSSTVFMKTQTDAGLSVASNESSSFIAYTTPTSPLITAVASLDGGLSVQFVDGSFNGTNKIGYKYSVDDSNYYWCNTITSPVVISGLTNGTAYSVSLKTVTDRGETDAYTYATAVVPSNMQLPPNIISIDASNATIVLGYTNPQLNGATITGYLYSLNGGDYVSSSSVVDASNSKITISGLTNGTAYAVSIKSVSANGVSGSSNLSKTVTPYAPPSAPVISKVVTGSQIANVFFTDGALNGSPAILGYKYSLDGVNYTWSSVTTSPIPLTGLTNAIAYTVRLVAVTSVNQSAPSAASSAFVPFALPAPPTITSVSAGIGTAIVTFTAGATNGRPLSGYKYSVNGGEQVSIGLVSTFTVSGLAIGEPHYITMYAVNAAGTSIASVPSQSFVPYNTPGAPVIESLTPANNAIIVKVRNPVLNGTDFNEIPIIGYEWSFNETSGFTFVSTANDAITFTISGLQNGVNYQVYVKSVTSIGKSPVSALSPAFVPCDVPDAPVVSSLVPYDQKAQLFFTDGSNNGAAITGYKYSFDGVAYYTALQKTSPLTLFSLSNSSSYQVYLKATNAMGDSANSNMSNDAIPFGVPFAPVVTSAIPGNGCVYLYFNPIDNNGSPITGIKYSLGAAALDASGVTSPVTIPNLVNKTTYNISIIAVNAAGSSYASNIVSMTAGVPTAPVITAVEASAKTLRVYFDAPLDNGNALTQYQWSVVGSAKFSKALGMASPLVIGGLSNGQAYNVVIQAVNKNGASPISNSIGNRIPFDLPGKMAISSVVPFFGGCTINFLAPPTNGAAITKYAYNISTDLTGAYVDLSGVTSPLTITGIPNNTSYTLKMIAYNAAGASPVSAPSKAAKFVYLPPAQPKITAVSAIYQTLFVNFTAPAINGTPITSYKYSLNGGDFIDLSSNVIPMMITGVQNNTNYAVAIKAVSAAGDSVASAAAKPVSYVYLPPAAPAVATVVGGDQSAVVTFTAPKTFNADITGYKYTLNGGAFLDASGLVSPITITGLTNDVSYNVVLYANSAAGLSPASAAKLVTPVYRVPDVPVVKSILVSTDTASITLTLGAANGSPITSIMYSLDNGVTYVDSGSLTGAFVVTGLVSKQQYSFRAYVTNALGSSAICPVKPFVMK